jgi:hypothetical protein
MYTVRNSEVWVSHHFRFATLPLPNPADFSRSRGKTRVWRRASPAERRLRRLLANRFAVCAKRAERSVSALLDFKRDCGKLSSANLSLPKFSCIQWKIQKFKFLTASYLPHFRPRTLLIFHHPVTKRARRRRRRQTPRSGVAQA